MTPPPATPPPTPPPGEPSRTHPGGGRGDGDHIHLPTWELSRQELAVVNRGMVNEEHAPSRLRRYRRRPMVGGTDVLSRRVRRALARHVSEHDRALFCLRGSLSHSLIALEERLLIVKPGFHAGTTFGSLVTTFYYQDITGIQVHTFLVTGWIEVSSPSFQGRERKRNRQPRHSDRDVYKLPTCIPIMRRHLAAYQDALVQLRERIEFCKRYARSTSEPRRCSRAWSESPTSAEAVISRSLSTTYSRTSSSGAPSRGPLLSMFARSR